MVPNGWKNKEIGDITLNLTSGSRDWAQYYSEIGSKFIRMTNLNRQGINLLLNDLKYVKVSNDSADGKRTSLEHGDILLSITAELGKIGWVPENFGEAFINQHTALIRVDKNLADSKFIAYQLSSPKLNKIINSYNDAGAKAGLNLPTIKSIPILYPPISEQKKIAQILFTWDKAIATTEKLLESSQKQKKALMQQLLTGKKRFLKFEDNWQETTLGKLFRIETGTSKSQYINNTGDKFIIDMGSVSRDGKLIPTKKTNFSADFLVKGQLVMPKDDIGGGNIIGRVGYIDLDHKYILGDHVYALAAKNSDSLFLNYLINSHRVNKNLRRKANGTAQLGLGKSDVLKQPVTIPENIQEQQKIAKMLALADSHIDTLQQKVNCLKKEKKALMQQLLTGKRRVRV